jgi:hypothetical protein
MGQLRDLVWPEGLEGDFSRLAFLVSKYSFREALGLAGALKDTLIQEKAA